MKETIIINVIKYNIKKSIGLIILIEIIMNLVMMKKIIKHIIIWKVFILLKIMNEVFFIEFLIQFQNNKII